MWSSYSLFVVVNAMSALLDQVDKELAAQLQTSDIEEVMFGVAMEIDNSLSLRA